MTVELVRLDDYRPLRCGAREEERVAIGRKCRRAIVRWAGYFAGGEDLWHWRGHDWCGCVLREVGEAGSREECCEGDGQS
jgi:hypothetical protein